MQILYKHEFVMRYVRHHLLIVNGIYIKKTEQMTVDSAGTLTNSCTFPTIDMRSSCCPLIFKLVGLRGYKTYLFLDYSRLE